MNKVIRKVMNKTLKTLIILLVAFVLLGVCVGTTYVGVAVLGGLIQGIKAEVFSIGELLFGGIVGSAVGIGALVIGIRGIYSVLSISGRKKAVKKEPLQYPEINYYLFAISENTHQIVVWNGVSNNKIKNS